MQYCGARNDRQTVLTACGLVAGEGACHQDPRSIVRSLLSLLITHRTEISSDRRTAAKSIHGYVPSGQALFQPRGCEFDNPGQPSSTNRISTTVLQGSQSSLLMMLVRSKDQPQLVRAHPVHPQSGFFIPYQATFSFQGMNKSPAVHIKISWESHAAPREMASVPSHVGSRNQA